MLFYVLIFVYCIILFLISLKVKDIRIKKFLTIAALFVLCIVSGTRYNIGGADYFAYKSIYNHLPINEFWVKLNDFSSLYGIEKGYLIYLFIIKSLGFNYYGYTLINSVVFYTLFYNIIKKYNYNMNFIIILFLYKMFFYNTFVSMRQPLAILVFWFSIDFLKEKKYIPYFVMCFLALMFHRGAIILFIIPFITNINFSKKAYFSLLVIGMILFIFVRFNLLNFNIYVVNILNSIFRNDASALNRIELYSHSSYSMSVFYTIEYYLIALLLYNKYDSIYYLDNNSKIFINLFICTIPFYTFFSSFSIVTRFKDFFFLCYPVLIYYIVKYSKKYDVFIYGFTIVICLYGYIRYLINFDGGSLMPYDSFLFKSISIFM